MSDYLSRKAPQRLAYWKAKAEKAAPAYRDWREYAKGLVGFKLKPDGLSQGSNDTGRGKVPIWYCHSQQLRETPVHEVIRMSHTGWYTDNRQSDLCSGIVVKLPHGRWLAGYHLSMSGERVIFANIYDDAEDAARAADSHAERIAEDEREHSQRFDDAQTLLAEIDSATQRLQECFALRRHAKLGEAAREELAGLIVTIREKCETLQNDYADYI